MARQCKICGKGIQRGNNVSHANNKTPKLWWPNIHKMRIKIDGNTQRVYVCTSCVKANKIIKPTARPKQAQLST
jgi:large subunit ribosomal protein L28